MEQLNWNFVCSLFSKSNIYSMLSVLKCIFILCIIKYFRAYRPWSSGISFPDILPKTTFGILKGSQLLRNSILVVSPNSFPIPTLKKC